VHSKERDEVCLSFLEEIFTKSVHRGGVLYCRLATVHLKTFSLKPFTFNPFIRLANNIDFSI
jgi:hypothetical protein